MTIDDTLRNQIASINQLSENVINSLESIYSSMQVSRYGMSEYQSILLEILQVNACTPINRFIDTIPDTNTFKAAFDLDYCQKSYGGILQKGLLVAIQVLLDGLE